MKKIVKTQQEWLKVLGKGMVTIPKKWRDELGFEEGNLLRAQKKKDKIVIESLEEQAPYRVYPKEELKQFLKGDRLNKEEEQKIQYKLKKLSADG